jgi:lambda repressor-like predicted transcriptional regulator
MVVVVVPVVLTGASSKQLRGLIALATVLPPAVLPVPGAPPVPPVRVHQVTAEEQVAIMAGYERGASIRDLAAEHGLTRQTVSSTLRRLGVPMRPRRVPTALEIQRAVEVYEPGWSLAKIGRELGFDSKTVWRHLNGNVVMRPPWEHPVSS